MAKNTVGTDNEKHNERGRVPRLSRTQEKRLTRQLLVSPLRINRDHLDSEYARFSLGDAERLRKAII